VATWGWACTKQGQNPNWGFNQTTAGQGCTTFNCCAGSCGGANAVGALGGCPGSGMSKLGTNTNFACMTCGTYPINVTVNGCNGGRGQGYLQTVGAGGSCGGTSNAGGAGGTWGNNGDAQISAGVAGTGGRSIDGISNITAYNAANTGVLLGPTI
jgi:hypothetical protein